MSKKTVVTVEGVDYVPTRIEGEHQKFSLGELVETLQFYWPKAKITVESEEVQD